MASECALCWVLPALLGTLNPFNLQFSAFSSGLVITSLQNGSPNILMAKTSSFPRPGFAWKGSLNFQKQILSSKQSLSIPIFTIQFYLLACLKSWGPSKEQTWTLWLLILVITLSPGCQDFFLALWCQFSFSFFLLLLNHNKAQHRNRLYCNICPTYASQTNWQQYCCEIWTSWK